MTLKRRLAACVVVLAGFALVWVDSNWQDADAPPLPASLTPAADAVLAQDNVYWDLAGLLVPAGADPGQSGLVQWQRASANIRAAAKLGKFPQGTQPDYQPLALPAGPPFRCKNDRICDELWFQNIQELQSQLARHDLLAQRCERIAKQSAQFEEPLATLEAAAEFAPHLSGLAFCARLLDAKGAIAVANTDAGAALRWYGLANGLLRNVAAKGKLPATKLVGNRLLVQHWRSLVAAGQRSAALAKQLMPLAAELAPAALDLHRGAVGAAFYARSGFDLAATYCQNGGPCERWPHLPNQTKIDADAQWLAYLSEARVNAVEELESVRAAPVAALAWWDKLHWRNTWFRSGLGDLRIRLLPDVAALADVDLTRAAAELALRARGLGLPPDERAQWLLRQSMRASFRNRIELDTARGVLVVSPWSRDFDRSMPKDFYQFSFEPASP